MKRARPYDTPDYRRRRQELMASIGPGTRCGRCGKLFGEHPRHADGRVGRWEAGHVVDGNNAGPLRLEHSLCNRSAGGQLGNQRRWRPRAADRWGGAGPHHPMHYSRPPCMDRGGEMCSVCLEWRRANPMPKRRGNLT